MHLHALAGGRSLPTLVVTCLMQGGSPSQAFKCCPFLRTAVTPDKTPSYWWSTSRQCSWKSLSFWERPCRSKTASLKNCTICFSCPLNTIPSIFLIKSHCLCNITIRAFTACKKTEYSSHRDWDVYCYIDNCSLFGIVPL